MHLFGILLSICQKKGAELDFTNRHLHCLEFYFQMDK